MHPTDFLWKSENFVKTSTMWLFVRGSSLFFPASGTSGDKSSALISPSWISSGLRKAAACTNLVAMSPNFELFTKSKFISHVVWTERRFKESYSLEGFAWRWLKSCKRSSLYSVRYLLIGHWRDLICAPACSKARGRQPSSTTSSFSVSSWSEIFSPLERLKRNSFASSGEKEKTSTQQLVSRSTHWQISFFSRLVVISMWPFDSLFHIPVKALRIFRESSGWSTLSRTISHSFSCRDINIRICVSVKSDEFSISPKRNARSFTQLSNFSSFSMENQNTPPSYCGLYFQANWAAKVVFPHPPRPQMAAILNSWWLFSRGRHLSSDSSSFCLPVNHLFRSGASNITDLLCATETLTFLESSVSQLFCIAGVLTSKILQEVFSRSCLAGCFSCLLLLNSCNIASNISRMLSIFSSSRLVIVSESATISSRMTLRNVSFSGLPTQNSNPKQN